MTLPASEPCLRLWQMRPSTTNVMWTCCKSPGTTSWQRRSLWTSLPGASSTKDRMPRFVVSAACSYSSSWRVPTGALLWIRLLVRLAQNGWLAAVFQGVKQRFSTLPSIGKPLAKDIRDQTQGTFACKVAAELNSFHHSRNICLLSSVLQTFKQLTKLLKSFRMGGLFKSDHPHPPV